VDRRNPSRLSIVSGGVLIALAVWVWVTMLVTKRMAGMRDSTPLP